MPSRVLAELRWHSGSVPGGGGQGLRPCVPGTLGEPAPGAFSSGSFGEQGETLQVSDFFYSSILFVWL